MLMPSDGTTTFNDMIRGEISFENALLDDQVLLKSDGLPTYHLAVVVDDHFMEISHVVRAEEWISSTPKHVLLYQYFGWEVPAFAHMPLLRNADRSKISKRKNNTSLRWYREQGFLPEAMLNFLALMGWSMPDGREMFGYDDVVREVSFERISTTGPVFDLVKLTAINGKYIRQLRVDELHRRVMPFVPESMDADRVRKIVPVIHDRLTRLGEFVELTGFFFAPPDYDAIALVPKKGTTELARTIMAEIRTFLGELATPWNREEWEAGLRNLAAARNVKPGDVFMMLRVAVTGSNVSPPLFESVEVLGADETRARVDSALNKLGE